MLRLGDGAVGAQVVKDSPSNLLVVSKNLCSSGTGKLCQLDWLCLRLQKSDSMARSTGASACLISLLSPSRHLQREVL